jgi:hypothetical protein
VISHYISRAAAAKKALEKKESTVAGLAQFYDQGINATLAKKNKSINGRYNNGV